MKILLPFAAFLLFAVGLVYLAYWRVYKSWSSRPGKNGGGAGMSPGGGGIHGRW